MNPGVGIKYSHIFLYAACRNLAPEHSSEKITLEIPFHQCWSQKAVLQKELRDLLDK